MFIVASLIRSCYLLLIITAQIFEFQPLLFALVLLPVILLEAFPQYSVLASCFYLFYTVLLHPPCKQVTRGLAVLRMRNEVDLARDHMSA